MNTANADFFRHSSDNHTGIETGSATYPPSPGEIDEKLADCFRKVNRRKNLTEKETFYITISCSFYLLTKQNKAKPEGC